MNQNEGGMSVRDQIRMRIEKTRAALQQAEADRIAAGRGDTQGEAEQLLRKQLADLESAAPAND